MNKIGVYFAYWESSWKADFARYVEKVRKFGFDVLEVSTAYMLNMPKSDLAELRKKANDEGVEITYCVGFSGDEDMASDDPGIRSKGIETAKRTLEIIHFMGGTVFGGINYTSWPGVVAKGILDKRPYLERSVSCMKEVIQTAEGYGITYCIEVVNRYEQFLINSVQEGIEYVNEVGSPNLKLLLDVFHMNIEEDNIGAAIKTAGDRIGHFHIGECNRKVPGKGHMPWNEIMGALKDINYEGRIVMEPFVRMGGEVGRDIKVWRDLSDEADDIEMDLDIKGALEFIREKLS